jgi:hypothetical protein
MFRLAYNDAFIFFKLSILFTFPFRSPFSYGIFCIRDPSRNPLAEDSDNKRLI